MFNQLFLIYACWMSLVQFHICNPVAAVQNRMSSSEAQSRGEQSLNIPQVVGEAMQSWQGTAEVAIPHDAQQAIENDFAQNEPVLHEIFDKRGLDESGRRNLLFNIVDYYLFDVRDVAFKALLKTREKKPIGDPGINPNSRPPYLVEKSSQTANVRV